MFWKHRLPPKATTKLDAIEQWLAAVRRNDIDAANATALRGIELCEGERDPFRPAFGWLRIVGVRLLVRTVKEPATCSFCGAPHDSPSIDKLIGGPEVVICSACIDAAAAISTTERSSRQACRFCVQPRESGVYQRGDAAICDPCLQICVDTLSDARGKAPWK
jgi:hypothetical protein